MTPDATRLAAAIRGWALDCGALVTRFVRRDDWPESLAEHLITGGWVHSDQLEALENRHEALVASLNSALEWDKP